MSDPVRSAPRTPDVSSERRLVEIRREAETTGKVGAKGERPGGAPFPVASPETGYYGIPLLKEPSWTWEIPLYFFVGGAAGAASIIATIARLTSAEPELVQRSLGGCRRRGHLVSPANF